jgi:Flp pilus assembly protein TadD
MRIRINWTRIVDRLCRSWHWLLRNWAAMILPPAMFLLVAGVTRQLNRAWEGSNVGKFRQHLEAAERAIGEGNLKAALPELEAAERLTPEQPEAHGELANAYRQTGRQAEALDHMERAFRLKPKEAGIPDAKSTWLGLAESNYVAGRMDVADRILHEDVLPRWPDLPDAHVYLGRIQWFRDGSEAGVRKALASFETALRLDPKHMDARKSYGDCMASLGRLEEAERAYRIVLEINPKHRPAAKELAGILRREGKLEAAKQVLAGLEALDQRTNRLRHLETKVSLQNHTLNDLLEIGELYLELDRNREAEQALLRYTRQEPTDPRGHRMLAEACKKLNRPKDAELSIRLADALEAKKGDH